MYFTHIKRRLYFFSQNPLPLQGPGHARPGPKFILYLLKRLLTYLLHFRDSQPSDPIVELSALRCCGGLPAAAVIPGISKAETEAETSVRCFSFAKLIDAICITCCSIKLTVHSEDTFSSKITVFDANALDLEAGLT